MATTITYNDTTVQKEQIPTRFKKEEKKWKSMATTIRGTIEGFRNKTLNDEKKGVTYTATEIRVLMDEVIEKFNEFYPQKIVRQEIEIIGLWKGIGTIQFFRGFQDDFKIRIPIKSKETGEVEWQEKEIKKEDVNRMLEVIKKMGINETWDCYEVSQELGYDWKELWKERTNLYFPCYYYPIKVLEAMEIISYSGKGMTTRKK